MDDCREACAEVAELAACAPVDIGFDEGFLGEAGTELRPGIVFGFPRSRSSLRVDISLQGFRVVLKAERAHRGASVYGDGHVRRAAAAPR